MDIDTNEPILGVNTGNAGKGRPKGAENKLNREVKQMILDALEQAGGVSYLVEQAKEKPVAFLALVGKVLPLQVTGQDGDPIKLASEVTFRIVRPSGNPAD